MSESQSPQQSPNSERPMESAWKPLAWILLTPVALIAILQLAL